MRSLHTHISTEYGIENVKLFKVSKQHDQRVEDADRYMYGSAENLSRW